MGPGRPGRRRQKPGKCGTRSTRCRKGKRHWTRPGRDHASGTEAASHATSTDLPPIVAIIEEQLVTRSQPVRDGLVVVNTRSNTPTNPRSAIDIEEGPGAQRAPGPSIARSSAHLRCHPHRGWRAPQPGRFKKNAGIRRSGHDGELRHLFDSSAERTADAMEAMYEEAAMAAPRTSPAQVKEF
jgi:hypothetical protein